MKWHLKILQKKEFEQAKQELKILEDDIAAAYSFFRRNRKGYFTGKKTIPLYLLLGPARFGKTTILSQAGLNLKNFNNQSLNSIAPTKYCSFWFSQEALYIDTAGTYTKPEITKPRNDLIWRGFIKLLQKYFGRSAIAGTLIILDLPAITQDITLLKKTLFCVRERIYELAAFIKALPLHIIFTKCDRILGFTEFFSLLNLEERSQPYGIAFTDSEEKIDPVPMFANKFNELLKHLNARVIERLQKSTHLDECLLIKTFPSQFNNLNQILLEVLSQIPSSRQISLSGIYFTSSIQDGKPIDTLKNSFLHAFNLKEKPSYKPETSNNCSYFIENIFKQVIITTKQQQRSRLFWLKPQLNYFYAVIIAGLIISTSCIIGYQSYRKNTATINKVKYLLHNQIITTNIDSLYTEIHQLAPVMQSWWLKLGVNKTKSILRELYRKHQISFLQILTLQLENKINSILNSATPDADPKKLHTALQTYLMLGDPKRLEPNYIKTWFNVYWSESYDDASTQKTKLQQQLTTTLQHPFKIKLKPQIIATARKNLKDFPLAALVYLSLENTYIRNSAYNGVTHPIAKIYTREYFHKIYNEKIPKLIHQLPQQDWVLATTFNRQLTAQSTADLIKNVRTLYVEKYAKIWETAAANYVPQIDRKNLSAAGKDLNTLAASNSPLMELLQQIAINTNIENAPPLFVQAINSRLQGLNVVNLATLQQKLENLAHHFTTVMQEQDPNKVAFDTVLSYLQNEQSGVLTTLKTFANYQPPQLRVWLQTIIKKSWAVLLDTATQHIAKSWQTMIIPSYQKMLANKYPIFKDSKEDVSLDDFNQFFGPRGLIDSFFNRYIKPFVNIDATNWTWKNIDEQKINFSQNSLEVFLRAALIQKMFYALKTPNPKVQFTLTPLEMTPNTQGFTLYIEGKKIIFTNEEKKSYRLVWPGSNPELVSIDFINLQGKYFNTSQFGTWAWFRIIDQSNIIPIDGTKHFELTFDLNGHAAKYKLSTPEAINPFIPNIINHFRCPDQLN